MSLPRRYYNISQFEDGGDNGDLTYARKRSSISSNRTAPEGVIEKLRDLDKTRTNSYCSNMQFKRNNNNNNNNNNRYLNDRVIEELIERIDILESQLESCNLEKFELQNDLYMTKKSNQSDFNRNQFRRRR